MEISPESRLPEAHSLPDGFVDSSEEEPRLYSFSQKSTLPVSSEKIVIDRAASAAEAVSSHFNLLDSDDDVRGLSIPAAVGDGSVLESAPEARVEEDHPSLRCGEQIPLGGGAPNLETLKSWEFHAAKSKLQEMSANKQTNPKPISDEVYEGKLKAGKRNVKSGKESSDFDIMRYQKVITERDAAIAVRGKLESLCRELQRQNKLLMEECRRVSAEGKNLRSEFSKKFNDTIEDVNKKLDLQKQECIAQLKENELLRSKLIQLTEQYAASEKAFQEKLEKKMLELQLADLRIKQHQEKTAQEQTQKKLYLEQITELLESEKSLRLQLASDAERFEQFQEALQKSNEVFENFNKEMKKMSNLVNDLKKENTSLKSKCEERNYSITGLLSEREVMKKEMAKVKRQKDNLESLCRSLQAERKKNREDSGQKSSKDEEGNAESAV